MFLSFRTVKKFGNKNRVFQKKKKAPTENSRKTIRKQKRQQKKVNRFNYHNVKKKERMKALKDGKKLSGRKNDESDQSDNEWILDILDESIPSEFEGDDGDLDGFEDEPTATGMGKIEQNILKAKKEETEYYSDIKKNRIDQLKQANEEEDKIIKKYETLLKLNRKKSKTGGTKSFNDGLEYILDLCTEENIKKMYSAAKEVAEDVSSGDEFDADLKLVMGESAKPPKKKKSKKSEKESPEKPLKNKDIKRMEKLKEAEKKYFDDDEDFLKAMEFDSCEGSDSEIDEAPEEVSSKKPSKVKFADESSDKLADSADSDFDIENSDVEDDGGSDGSENQQSDGEEESDIGDPEEFDGQDNDSETEIPKKSQKPEIWEDIYGRKRDKDGIIKESTGKYVPPAMRKKIIESSDLIEMDPKKREKLMNLKKQLKGFVNRLAEANLCRISIDIENVYSNNARHDVNSLLTEIILDAIISNVLTGDRMVLEHTLLIATLHANIGSEIGAYFLQILVERFNESFQQIDNFEVEDKKIDNLILIICHLFTFKIFQHNLIYELLEKLAESLTEKRVECMLLVLRSIGFLLRKEDPLKLKEYIIDLQKKANNLREEFKSSSRILYMVDILLAIKNNNMTKIPQYDSSLVEHFKKLLKQFTRAGKYVTTLNITMEDLLNADERGKWWLVGSAWAGIEKEGKEKKIKNDKTTDEDREKILDLARKQRINTDDKKAIFYILMTAEDYLDAFEKIISSVKDERAIIAVILHCCLSEKTYNPYYSVLAQKFCDHNRKYQLTIQYAVWDKIKAIDELKMQQVGNLARFLIYLIENGNLAISVLKVIEFSQIEKRTLRFLRQIMLGLLMSDDEKFKQVCFSIQLNF
jgi:nucleolar MIF4G domain-containing protein 1